MNILEEITEHKRKEVKENKELYPVKLLERSTCFTVKPVSLKKYLLRNDLSGIIAEFKRQSPSKGMINEFAEPSTVCLEYMQAGASALSVLTDNKYFGGSNKDLITARKYNFCPIMRKDFIVDEYQVIEARSIGADVILLITEILTKDELKKLSGLAHELQMEVLFEVHDKKGIDKLPANAAITGINNRNLNNMSVNVDNCLNLINELPDEALKIAESGIDNPETVVMLKQAGFSGFLVSECFMRKDDPGKACELFIKKLNEAGAGSIDEYTE